MKYNIIGDIHGRTIWKDLVQDDATNIFVGDYFSPYDKISFDDQRNNFLDIVIYKAQHPETILLIGNHDEDHWHIKEHYSRFDYKHVSEITELFEEEKNNFQIAYSINNKALVTHAGVSIMWYVKYKYGMTPRFVDLTHDEDDFFELNGKYVKLNNPFKPSLYDDIYDALSGYNQNHSDFLFNYPKDGTICLWKGKYYMYKEEVFVNIDVTPNDVSDFINNIWNGGRYVPFNFRDNCNSNDCYGDSPQQSPIWIRPDALQEYNIFKNTPYIQIVGHTQIPEPVLYKNNVSVFAKDNMFDENEEDKIVFVDCLGFSKKSYTIEL